MNTLQKQYRSGGVLMTGVIAGIALGAVLGAAIENLWAGMVLGVILALGITAALRSSTQRQQQTYTRRNQHK